LENWNIPKSNIIWYFSQKIWIHTTIKLKNFLTYRNEYLNKYIKEIKNKLIEEITNLYNSFSSLDNSLNHYQNLWQTYFDEKIWDISIEIEQQKYNDQTEILETIIKTDYTKIKEEIKEKWKEAYNLVQEEIKKNLWMKKEELKEKWKQTIQESVFDKIDIFSDVDDELSENREIDFSGIVIEDYKLFVTVEEFKKAIIDYYAFQEIKVHIETIDGLDSYTKKIIVKKEDWEIILDMTFDLNNKNPIEFHFHRYCEWQEEEIKDKIMKKVNNNWVIEFEDLDYTLDKVLKNRENISYNY
jgi:hypothetical protein